jgi:hypothetical protein
MVIRAIPSGHGYAWTTPVRHSFPKASFAGARRWMKAVATMTPDPKYFAIKNAHDGTSFD